MDYFLCVIGMVMVIEGLPYFAFPHKMKMIIYTVLEMSDDSLRKLGLFLIAMGLLTIYCGRH